MSGVAQHTVPDAQAKTRLRLWLRLLKISRRIEAELRDNLRREFASTLPRFDVMAALSRYEKGLKMSGLSGVLKVSNGNVTGIVDRLVEDGFVMRVPVPGDRRASLVRLTRSGRAAFVQQAEAHERWVNQLLRGFSAAEAQSVSDLLEAVMQTNVEEKASL
ncbi:MAG: MarR family winged helix-turn-helix transcriptional regulator [Paracoccaceae bacterium]